MPYRGRYQQGQEIQLACLCRNGAGTPTQPTASPTVEIWNSSGAKGFSAAIPILDRYGQLGLFGYPLFLDGRFPTGSYLAVYHYTVGSYIGIDLDSFEVVDGGNPNGVVQAMTWFVTPQAKNIVYQTNKGRLFKGRNPTF
jgi:hypothetical protein